MTVYTTLPTSDLNLAVTVIDDPDLVELNITPASVNVTSAVISVNSLVGNVTLTTTEISEGTNQYYTDARADARVDLETGANLDLSFMDTDDLAEGPTNLYYTTARDSAQFNTDLATKDTDDLTEGTNLYYTDSRFDSRLATKDTDDLTEGTNLYYTDSRFDSRLATKDTDDLTEGSNLYFTDARAQTVITANTEGFIKADSTDTLTNKSGSNSQWTNDEAYLKAAALTPYYTKTQTDALPVSTFSNDAGYITSETDSQTLSFSTPDLTISNGNSVDLTSLKTTSLAFSSITSTPTTVAGYGITDAFDGVFASLTSKPTTVAGYGITDAFSGDYDDLTNKPTIPTNNNQLSNGAAYITASSSETLTNKSGNISMFTNDAGYLTSETDNQTLSFLSPDLTISGSLSSVDLSALTDGGTY